MHHRVLIFVGLVAWIAGCLSYERVELDVAAHEQAWADRAIDDQRVEASAELLADSDPQPRPIFDSSDGLSLQEAEPVALIFNAELRVARLRAKAPLLGAKEAGRWEDPELDFDLLRITESVEDPWIVGTSLRFTIPLSGRLEFEEKKAFAEADVALRQALLAEWRTLGALRAAWTRWTGTTRRLALLQTYLAQLDEILALAQKQRQANRIGAPQLRVLQLEKVGRMGELQTLRLKQKRQRLAIHALLGLKPDAPVELEPSLPLDQPLPDADDRRETLRDHNLQLAVAKADYQVADHAYHLQIRKQFPDLTIGPGFENEEGVSRAGVVMSIPIPLLNQNRRAIAEARAERDAAKAAYEATYERLVAELSQAELRVEEAKVRSTHLQTNVAPMVDQQMADLRRLAELGDLDVLVLLDALTRTLETKVQVLESTVEQALALNALRLLLRPTNTPELEVSSDDQE